MNNSYQSQNQVLSKQDPFFTLSVEKVKFYF